MEGNTVNKELIYREQRVNLPLCLMREISRNGFTRFGMKLPFLSPSLCHREATWRPVLTLTSPNLQVTSLPSHSSKQVVLKVKLTPAGSGVSCSPRASPAAGKAGPGTGHRDRRSCPTPSERKRHHLGHSPREHWNSSVEYVLSPCVYVCVYVSM